MNHISYIFTLAILMQSMDVRTKSFLQTSDTLTYLSITAAVALYYATVFMHVRYLSCVVYELTPKCHYGVTYRWALIAKITMT